MTILFCELEMLPGASTITATAVAHIHLPVFQLKGAKNLKHQDFRVKRYEYINFPSFLFSFFHCRVHFVSIFGAVHHIHQNFLSQCFRPVRFLRFFHFSYTKSYHQSICNTLFMLMYMSVFCLLKVWMCQVCDVSVLKRC